MISDYTGYPDVYDPTGITSGPDGALWFTNYSNNSIGRIFAIATTTTASVNPTSTTAGSSVVYSATVAPTSGPGTPTGTVRFTRKYTVLCTVTLSAGKGSCSASNTPVGIDTVKATYGGSTIYVGSYGTTTVDVSSKVPTVTCGKLTGSATATLTLSTCAPASSTNTSATSPGLFLTAGGTFTWHSSSKTTVIKVAWTAKGQGACAVGSTEHDGSGIVTGGTSTYTKTV